MLMIGSVNKREDSCYCVVLRDSTTESVQLVFPNPLEQAACCADGLVFATEQKSWSCLTPTENTGPFASC